MRLNLGAGSRTLPGYVNVDRVQMPGIDQVWDLDVAPWPWEDGSADSIHARDVFEHVADAVLFMTECHRVLAPGGTLWIRCPNISLNLADAFTDPTHRRFPTWSTFDYWIPDRPLYDLHNTAYGGVAFNRKDSREDEGSMVVILVKP